MATSLVTELGQLNNDITKFVKSDEGKKVSKAAKGIAIASLVLDGGLEAGIAGIAKLIGKGKEHKKIKHFQSLLKKYKTELTDDEETDLFNIAAQNFKQNVMHIKPKPTSSADGGDTALDLANLNTSGTPPVPGAQAVVARSKKNKTKKHLTFLEVLEKFADNLEKFAAKEGHKAKDAAHAAMLEGSGSGSIEKHIAALGKKIGDKKHLSKIKVLHNALKKYSAILEKHEKNPSKYPDLQEEISEFNDAAKIFKEDVVHYHKGGVKSAKPGMAGGKEHQKAKGRRIKLSEDVTIYYFDKKSMSPKGKLVSGRILKISHNAITFNKMNYYKVFSLSHKSMFIPADNTTFEFLPAKKLHEAATYMAKGEGSAYARTSKRDNIISSVLTNEQNPTQGLDEYNDNAFEKADGFTLYPAEGQFDYCEGIDDREYEADNGWGHNSSFRNADGLFSNCDCHSSDDAFKHADAFHNCDCHESADAFKNADAFSRAEGGFMGLFERQGNQVRPNIQNAPIMNEALVDLANPFNHPIFNTPMPSVTILNPNPANSIASAEYDEQYGQAPSNVELEQAADQMQPEDFEEGQNYINPAPLESDPNSYNPYVQANENEYNPVNQYDPENNWILSNPPVVKSYGLAANPYNPSGTLRFLEELNNFKNDVQSFVDTNGDIAMTAARGIPRGKYGMKLSDYVVALGNNISDRQHYSIIQKLFKSLQKYSDLLAKRRQNPAQYPDLAEETTIFNEAAKTFKNDIVHFQQFNNADGGFTLTTSIQKVGESPAANVRE